MTKRMYTRSSTTRISTGQRPAAAIPPERTAAVALPALWYRLLALSAEELAVCPVRPARAANVRFYPSAAAAEIAGFRPCLRCRPETAPFCPAWNGSRTTAERTMRCVRFASSRKC